MSLFLLNSSRKKSENWRLVEFFAGKANLSFCAQNLKFQAVSLDVDYGGRYMDIMTPPGMACFVCSCTISVCLAACGVSSNQSAMRLAVAAVLQLQPHGVAILAPVCSSLSDMCVSVSKRAWYCPLGDTSRDFVRRGNLMAHRWESTTHMSAHASVCM